MTTAAPATIKKYGNRRLYDTQDSRYVTLEELAEKVRGGTDVRVVDAKTGTDLTRATLTQIIIEGRGAAQLFPVNVLNQLIRLGDDALAEFLGRYLSGALELYQQMRRGAQSLAPYNPLASLPFTATDTLARMWMGNPFQGADPGRAAGFGGAFGAGPAAPVSGDPAAERAPEPSRPQTEPGAESPEGDGAGAAGQSSEVAALRRELEELKRSMARSEAENPPKADAPATAHSEGEAEAPPPPRKRSRARNGRKR